MIIALSLVLPFVFSLAVLQDQAVSRLLLNFTLKLVRFQTGVPLEAKDWTVQPFSFSLVFKGVEVQESKWKAEVETLNFQFSPLYLFVGRVHLKNFVASKSKISTSFKFFDSKEDENKTLNYQDISNDIAKVFGSLNNTLREQSLSFEDITFLDMTFDSPEVFAVVNEVYFQNLGQSQLRLKTSLEELFLKNRLEKIHRSELSALLMRQSSEDYYLALRDLSLRLYDSKSPQVKVSGRLPGDVNFKVDVDAERLNEYLKSSPLLKEEDPDVFLSGGLKASGHIKIGAQSLESTKLKLNLNDFKIDVFHPNNVDLSLSSNFDQWSIEELKIELPRTSWEPASVSNTIIGSSIKVVDDKIEGSLNLNRAGLCAILRASSVEECHVDLKISGKVALDGTLKDFNLLLYPDLALEAFDVYSDPKMYRTKESSKIVTANPAKLTGVFRAREQDLIIENAMVAWSDKSFFSASGDVKYKPTVVSIRATSSQLKLKEAIDNFIGISLVGGANTETTINYRHDAVDPKDKTKVTSTVTITDVDLLGQSVGELKGTVEFVRKRLRIGPFSMAQGGGLAHILGNLYFKDGFGTWLDLDCLFDQYEFGFVTGSGAYPVKGVWSGTASLRGILGGDSAQAFKGPIKLTGKNVESFGIPFENVDASGEVGLVYLDIKDLSAHKSGGVLKLKGNFKDEGSWVEYSSDKVAIASLGLFPDIEKVFSKGDLKAKGRWDDSGLWTVDAGLSDLKVASYDFDAGSMKVNGNDSGINLSLDLDKENLLSYETVWSDDNLRAKTVRADLDSRGVYAALAILNGWTTEQLIKVAGRLKFDWSTSGGALETIDFKVLGPKGADATQVLLLDAQGKQKIAWEGLTSTSGELYWGGDSALGIKGGSKDHFLLSGELSAPLVDLFIPDILKLRSGKLVLKSGRLHLPPKLKNLSLDSTLKDSELSVSALGQPIQSTVANIFIEDSLLKISNGRGRLGAGWVNFEGQYKIDFESEGIVLRSDFDKAQIVLLEEYPMTVSGNVSINGATRPYQMTGSVNLLEGLYSNEFSTFTPSILATEVKPDLLFNVRANINDQFLVKNSLINTRIRGTLFVLGNNVVPELQGVLFLEGGSLFARDNTFQVERGTLSFARENSNIPIVSLQAETNVRYNTESYKINLLASGRATEMKLDFNSEPALSTQDTISLLTFGFIRSDFENGANAGQDNGLVQSAGVEAFQAIFGKQIGASINKSTGFNVSLSTKVDSADAQAVPKVEVMRRLGDKTTATFGRSLDLAKPENNLQVDYQLLKNLNLTGVWESPEPDEEEQSMGADLRFKFDLK
ncbi:hypothetical protein GW915_06490 [bacterium]|nr:hypothetical protein [bacterium]